MSESGQREESEYCGDMSDSPCVLKLKSLETVEGAVSCLKNGEGQAASHELWKVGEYDRRYGKATNDVTRFDAAEATKRRLKDAREALVALTRSIDGCLADVHATLEALPPVTLYRGMRAIPNEIVALIFDRVYDAGLEALARLEQEEPVHDYDWGKVPANADNDLLCSVLRLAHVSRKFRAIVLRLPRLWSHISMAYKPAAVDFLLERSKAAGLTIVLPLATPFTRPKGAFHLACDGFMKKLLVHAWRIKAMQFYLDEDDGWGIDPMRVFAALKKDWFNIDLPKLETLCVHMPYDIIDDDDFDEEFNVDVRDFYSTWNLPRLRRLDFKNFTPTFPTPGSITHCTIGSTEGEGLNIHALAQFLRVSPSLEILTLRLKDCRPFLHEETEVRLPNLWSLAIDCHLDDDLPRIFKQLRLPRLQALSVTLDIRSEDELAEIREDEGKFASYFPELDKEVKTVTSLGVIIRRKPPPYIDDLDGAYLATFLSKLPALDELYVEAPYTLLATWDYIPKSRIRRLRLKNCDLFPISFFRRWEHRPSQQNMDQAIDALEEVEVHHCPSMAKEELASLLSGKRLTWLP